MNKSVAQLIPTTTVFSPRYDQTRRVKPEPQSITAGLFSSIANPEPKYLPPLWGMKTHPEGSVYFVRNSVPKVVTGACLFDGEQLNGILEWIQVVDDLADAQGIKLTDTMEIYVEPSEEQSSCRYYIIDHATRTMLWLECVNSEDVGLLPTVSDDHLRTALEELYWQHVEYFPCHDASGFNPSIKDLLDVFLQAEADHLTSLSSTFSYSAEQCKQFVKILKTYQASDNISAYGVWTIARLWSNVASYRLMNHHGQEVCRMSADQSIVDVPKAKRHCVLMLVSTLMFGVPETYTRAFEKLWVDETVNVHRWQSFFKCCHSEWKACLLIGFALLFTNMLFMMSSGRVLAPCYNTCVLLSYATILSSIVMLMRHWRCPTETATDAAEFLTNENDNRAGFQYASVEFSLPRALLLWALTACTLQTLFVFLGIFSTCIVAASGISTFVVCKFYAICVSQASKFSSWIGRKFRHTEENTDCNV